MNKIQPCFFKKNVQFRITLGTVFSVSNHKNENAVYLHVKSLKVNVYYEMLTFQ